MKKNTFGDYIVFVDESGDQSLVSIDKQYPVFVLSFCIFEKKNYIEHVVPEILKLKFDFFGSNIPILHEREIRKRTGVFNILMEDTVRNEFFNRLNQIIESSNFTIVSTVIDKNKYSHYDAPKNPYFIGMDFGIERIFMNCRNVIKSVKQFLSFLKVVVRKRILILKRLLMVL